MSAAAQKKGMSRDEGVRFKRQIAALLTGYGDIWLVREGDYAVVKIEYNGAVVEVIREPIDCNFSHCITPLGIEEELKRLGMMPEER